MRRDLIKSEWSVSRTEIQPWVSAHRSDGSPIIVDHWYLGVLLGGHRDGDVAREVVAEVGHAP